MFSVSHETLEKINSDLVKLSAETEEILYISKSLQEEIETDLELTIFPEKEFIVDDLAVVKKSLENMVMVFQELDNSSRKLLKELENN